MENCSDTENPIMGSHRHSHTLFIYQFGTVDDVVVVVLILMGSKLALQQIIL